MAFSGTQEQNALDSIKTGGVYVGLHSADEGNEPDGSNEVGAADYSRAFVAEADLSVSGTGPATIENTVEVEWTSQTNNNWGTITHFSFWTDTQANSGRPYTETVQLTSSFDAPSGVRVFADPNALVVDID